MKIFITLFSGTVRSTKLKLSTQVDNGWMYRVYQNQAAVSYLSLYSFFFLSNFQTLKCFVTLFSGTLRPTKLKLGTVGGCIVCTGIRLLLLINPFISSFFFLSNFQTLNFLSHFSQEQRPKKCFWYTHHMYNMLMYCVYQNLAAAAAYLCLYFFIFLSVQFLNIKFFRHTFLRNCEAYKVETWYTRTQWEDV